ncbi:DUF1642 domain-containing protein [Listeria monocytogenes]
MKFREGENVHVIVGNELLNGWYNGKEFGTGNSLVKVSRDKIISTKDCFIAKEKEAELIVVPQCVADWYEQHRYKLEHSIWQYIYCWDVQKRKSDFYNFMKNDNLKPVETLIRMRYGYEVEKEPLYYVKLIEGVSGYLNVRNDGIQFLNSRGQTAELKTRFTEKEIKAMDKGDAYWQFAVLVEEAEGEA